MKLSSAHKLIGMSLALVAVALAVLWGFLYVVKKVNDEAGALESIRGEVASAEAERQSVRQSESILKSRENDIARIENFLIDPVQPVDFIEALEGLAQKTNNVIVLDINDNGAPKGQLAFHINLTGTQKSVLNYLTLLQLLPYQISIQDFNYQKTTKGSVGQKNSASDTNMLLTIQVKTKIGK